MIRRTVIQPSLRFFAGCMASLLLLVSAASLADEPKRRQLSKSDRTTLGRPLAAVARELLASIPDQARPCKLDRAGADLSQPETLLDKSGIVSDGVVRPDNWVVGIICNDPFGSRAIVKADPGRISLEILPIKDGTTAIAAEEDFLHFRSDSEPIEILFVRSAEQPTESGLAAPRTFEIHWFGVTPTRESVQSVLRVARQVLAKAPPKD